MKVDGSTYKLQSIKCIQADINRYTKEFRNLDITADPRFTTANEVFKAVAVKYKSTGKAATKSKKHPHDLQTVV